MKFLIFLMMMPAAINDYPKADDIGLTKWSKARNNVDYGHPIINDVESYVPDDKFSKSMRNKLDKGNWVHEQTHYVNAKFGISMKNRTKKHGWTSAYVLGGWAFTALQPEIKLTAVKSEMGEDPMGLLDRNAIKAWNDWPLYVLDEASASTNALAYEVAVNGRELRNRAILASEWARVSDALIKAVEKGDARYKDLGRLRAFIEWHNARIRYLSGEKGSPDYKLY
jgi:hypothetical protein